MEFEDIVNRLETEALSALESVKASAELALENLPDKNYSAAPISGVQGFSVFIRYKTLLQNIIREANSEISRLENPTYTMPGPFAP